MRRGSPVRPRLSLPHLLVALITIFCGAQASLASALAQQQPPERTEVTPSSDPAGLSPEPIVAGSCQPTPAVDVIAIYRGDPAHSGWYPGAAGSTELQKAWSSAGFRTGHDPLVAGERVIAAKERAVAALDAESGRELWEVDGPGGRIAGRGLVVAGGTVFVAWENALAAYDLESGTECWRLPVGKATSPALADGRIYVSVDEGESGYVAAVDPSSGQILWRYDARNPAPALWANPTAPTVGDAMVFVADGREAVALDRVSGEARWRTSTGGNVAEGLAFADAVVYVPDRSRGLHALDAASGAVQWVFAEPGMDLNNPVAISDQHVYVADARHLHAIDRKSGSEVWKIDAERTSRFNAPIVVDDHLYAITHDGELVVVEIATGAEVQRIRVSDPVAYGSSTPAPGHGMLYFVLPDGSLNAYR